MEWLNVIGPILGIAALAFLGWRMEKNKVQSPAAWGAVVIVVLVLLVWLKGWGGYVLIILLLLLRSLEHIPAWLVCTVIGGSVGYYLLTLIANSLIEVAQEIKQTNARMQLMEDSLRAKLGEIASRLPETDSSE